MPSHPIHHVLAIADTAFHLGVWLVLLTVVILPLERLFALRQRRRTPGQIAADLAWYFLNGIVPTMVLAVPTALLAAAFRQITPQAYVDIIGGLPPAVRVLAGLAVAEVGAYWGHRLSHQVPFLWRFHVIHHAPDHLDWLVNTRAHPIDIAFVRLCGLLPLYALSLAQPAGAGSATALWITVLGTVWAFVVHMNVRWRLGPLEWLVATPAFHHWHHTNDEHRDRNYAAMLPVVDRLFGTHHLPAHWPPVYGVDEPPPEGFLDQLMHPLDPPARKPAGTQAAWTSPPEG